MDGHILFLFILLIAVMSIPNKSCDNYVYEPVAQPYNQELMVSCRFEGKIQIGEVQYNEWECNTINPELKKILKENNLHFKKIEPVKTP